MAYKAFAFSRSTNFWILPVEVFGNSENTTVRGTLNFARRADERIGDGGSPVVEVGGVLLVPRGEGDTECIDRVAGSAGQEGGEGEKRDRGG